MVGGGGGGGGEYSDIITIVKLCATCVYMCV